MRDDPGPARSSDDGLSDRDLVERFRDGEASAFDELVRRHERRVFNLAYRMLGRPEDARDAAQEAFVACFRNLDRFRGDAAFTTWLHRITVNICYDALRRNTPTLAGSDDEIEPPPVPDHADSAAAAVDVQRALLSVPEEFRAALVMHDVQGLPYEEVAAILGAPVGTVKSRLHRGRIALARALAGAGEHAPAADPSNPSSPGLPTPGRIDR